MTDQQLRVAEWAAMSDDTCECGRRHSTLLGLDGDRLMYQCTRGHVYRVVSFEPMEGQR